ncbi:MAG: hypothetical protein KDA81_06725 [Planctomycetaceae bacterium]|nr:hypothetical protein [Planctomycetaceae bacterium]
MKSLLICLIVGYVTIASTEPCYAMRLIRATISLDGQPLLQATTGDDGRQTGEVVWRYLDKMKFRPHPIRIRSSQQRETQTPGFTPPDEDSFVLIGYVRLEIQFGGSLKLDKLRLHRVIEEDGET